MKPGAEIPQSGEKPAGRRIALFGGTFDAIHTGHLAVAEAAEKRFLLDQVLFIPAGHPPHKPDTDLSPFPHRMAMVALACAGHARFVLSLAEAGNDGMCQPVFYSIDTVRHFRQMFDEPGDQLFFIVGADSFLHLPTWKSYEQLLGLCDFVVANRPGFPSDALRQVIPPALLGQCSEASTHDRQVISLHQTSVYLLDTVASDVSATEVRSRLSSGKSVNGLVPPLVEEYIKKQGLYRE